MQCECSIPAPSIEWPKKQAWRNPTVSESHPPMEPCASPDPERQAEVRQHLDGLFLRVQGLTGAALLDILHGDQAEQWEQGKPIWVESYVRHAVGEHVDEEGVLDLIF